MAVNGLLCADVRAVKNLHITHTQGLEVLIFSIVGVGRVTDAVIALLPSIQYILILTIITIIADSE